MRSVVPLVSFLLFATSFAARAQPLTIPPADPGAAAPVPDPTAAADSICVVADDEAGLELLVASLRVRGLDAASCAPGAAASWAVEANGLASTMPTVRVRSPDGTVWKPNVAIGGSADLEGRVRAAAVAVSAVLDLLLQGVGPSIPSEPPPGRTPPIEPPPVMPPPAVPAPEPADGPAADWSAALILAAASNLEAGGARLGTAGAVGTRLDVAFPLGVWLALDVDWTVTGRSRFETLLLETATSRLVVGAVLGPGVWTIRFGLGWAFQGWWTEGGVAPRGWRTGGTLLVAPAWQPIERLRIGVDFAIELYRTRVEIDHGDEPLFALDHWRWRAGLWAAVPFGRN